MSEHKWSFCEHCRAVMVLCGHCGNNTCNGGAGPNCPDRCASAHVFERDNERPADLVRRAEAAWARWDSMTEAERDAENQARFDGAFL